MHHQGRKATASQCPGVQDPLAPAAQLPPTAASEIVKAARAYLQDPTRPVTPAESSRHLLQSSCGYSNRPSTSGGCIGSNEFLTAAVSDGLCWDGRNSSRSAGGRAGGTCTPALSEVISVARLSCNVLTHSNKCRVVFAACQIAVIEIPAPPQSALISSSWCAESSSHGYMPIVPHTPNADMWVADVDPEEANSSWGSPAGHARSQRVTGTLPGLSRAPVPTPSQATQQPLPYVSKTEASRHCSSTDSSSRRGRAASAGGVSTGSRLAELGTLVPLRPATAQQAAEDMPVQATPSQRLTQRTGSGVEPTAVSFDVSSSSGIQDSWQCLTHAPSEAGTCGLGPEGSDTVLAGREASTSTENSSVVRLGSLGGPSSRGSTAGSSCSRSRLSSRGSERCCKQTAQDSLSAAEAELDQLLLDADATEVPAAAGSATLQQEPLQASAASSKQWQQSVLSILQQIQALSLSPTDAPAVLKHCSQLQCLLDTAADWGCLQEWLHPAPLQTGASQLQPCVSRNLSSSNRAISGGGNQHGRPQGLGEHDLHAVLMQTLVRLVDSRKPDVLVKVGAMLLSITPTESYLLLPATKMLYTLSKDSSNDSRFRHHGVLRPLLQMTAALSGLLEQRRQQQHTSTALLYCSGCLKNVTADGTNQKSLGRLGGITTMAQVLFDQVAIAEAVAAAQQQVAQEQQTRHPQHETAAQVAVQAAAVLRNLSVPACNAPFFTHQSGAPLQALVSLLQPFHQDPEVLLNASRCLSKLSLYEGCRQGMLSAFNPQQRIEGTSSRSSRGSSTGGWSPPNRPSSSGNTQPTAVACMVQVLLSVQATQPKQWPMAIRLAFALGQLTTYHPESRQQVAAVAGALDAVPRLVLDLLQYSKLRQQAEQHVQHGVHLQGPQGGQLGLAEDLITKLLRLLANLAIDRTVGATLAARQATADALVAVLTGYDYDAPEELVLNATAALTNLAYYDKPSNKVLHEDADVLLLALLPLLTSSNEEAMCEAARAGGNLARASPSVRAALCDAGSRQQGEQHSEETSCSTSPAASASASTSTGQHASAGPYVLQSLVLLLDHGSWDVVHSVAGALVNLSALSEAGTVLSQVGLAAALAAALQRVLGVLGVGCSQQHDSQQQGTEEEEELCVQAAELLLQCVNNLVTASAAAMSEAVLGCAGARCAELACSSEDLACFSTVVKSLVDSSEAGSSSCSDGTEQPTVPACIRETAAQVQLNLTSLWGL